MWAAILRLRRAGIGFLHKYIQIHYCFTKERTRWSRQLRERKSTTEISDQTWRYFSTLPKEEEEVKNAGVRFYVILVKDMQINVLINNHEVQLLVWAGEPWYFLHEERRDMSSATLREVRGNLDNLLNILIFSSLIGSVNLIDFFHRDDILLLFSGRHSVSP